MADECISCPGLRRAPGNRRLPGTPLPPPHGGDTAVAWPDSVGPPGVASFLQELGKGPQFVSQTCSSLRRHPAPCRPCAELLRALVLGGGGRGLTPGPWRGGARPAPQFALKKGRRSHKGAPCSEAPGGEIEGRRAVRLALNQMFGPEGHLKLGPGGATAEQGRQGGPCLLGIGLDLGGKSQCPWAPGKSYICMKPAVWPPHRHSAHWACSGPRAVGPSPSPGCGVSWGLGMWAAGLGVQVLKVTLQTVSCVTRRVALPLCASVLHV